MSAAADYDQGLAVNWKTMKNTISTSICAKDITSGFVIY